MKPPVNSIEWLLHKIQYEMDREELRNIALLLCLALEDADTVDIIFGKEMLEDGFYDGYKDKEYDAAAGVFESEEDRKGWDVAMDLTIRSLKRQATDG